MYNHVSRRDDCVSVSADHELHLYHASIVFSSTVKVPCAIQLPFAFAIPVTVTDSFFFCKSS